MDKEKKELLNEFVVSYLTTFKNIEELVSKPTVKYGLSFEHFTILREISLSPEPTTLTQLAENRGVTKGAVARQLKGLIINDLIEQDRRQKDRRFAYITLSEKGQEILNNVTGEVVERWDGWIDKFGADNAWKLLKLMNKLHEDILSDDLGRRYNLDILKNA
ncbi:MAG: MarR family transcriptional regulator [Lactobacillaceae bacterium]|jgi:DNA-binding MarR family transcriptional regulator|nr:MarR family transcriptional regulator [Lactobacillaceae bacterium]